MTFSGRSTGVFVEDPPELQAARVAGTEEQPGRHIGGQQAVQTAAAVDGHRRDVHAIRAVGRPQELATDAVRRPGLFGQEDPTGLAVAGLGAV